MGWRPVIVGFAAIMAVWMGAWAQDASARDPRQVTDVQLPQRVAPAVPRGSEGVQQPRYATMVPPTQDSAPAVAQPRYATQNAPVQQEPGIERAPVAAPAGKVQVGPDATAPSTNQFPAQPRYSTQQPPPDRNELVTVLGLRQSEDSMYRLGPGDKLHITVFNETDLTGDFAVDGQGFVRLPLVGQVQAAGLTTFGLETRISDYFVNGGYLVNPRIAVEITTYRPFYIIGEIAKPGEYAYVNAMTAPNAIALAGGYTDRAVESTILIRRQGSPKEREFRVDETTRILPGDVIRVQRSTYWSIMTFLAPIISPFTSLAYVLK